MGHQEKVEAVKTLRSLDHCFIGTVEAESISEPFGFKAHTYVMAENRKDPKGLRFNDPDVVAARGVGAHDLAVQICIHLKIKYRSCMGRGFQLRACCDALDQYLGATKE